MIFWLLAGIEVLMQMILAIGLYLKSGDQQRGKKQWEKVIMELLLLLIYFIELYDKKTLLLAWGSIFLTIVIEGMWIWIWTKNNIGDIFVWIFFSRWTIGLAEMPAVIISSFRGGVYEGMEANFYPDTYGKGIQCLILFMIILFGWSKKNERYSVYTVISRVGKSTLFWIGLSECTLIFFLMNIIWESAQGADLLLNLVTIVCMFLIFIVQMFKGQYKIIENENKMYLLKEKILMKDYYLLKEEIKKNNRIRHDYRFDFAYLYNCIQNGDIKKAIDYLEKKQHFETRFQWTDRWTGYECIDFLIYQGKMRAEKGGVEYCVSANVIQFPMPEYDFFTVLGNLLDNAFEAVENCRSGERKIKLKMKSVNEIFLMAVENTYCIEPQKKNGNFLSKKKEKEKHGWGLLNVREIIERNGGTLKIEYENNVFLAQIMFGNGE